jgi:uncharacterized protein YfaS (alpha-2-macroglobulin family)
MSYIQGTQVHVSAVFTDHITDLPVDPAEVKLTIEKPSGDTEVRTLSGGSVTNDPLAVGKFTSTIDTTPEYGTWFYQFESTGVEATVGRRAITVRKRIVLQA